MLIHRVFDEVFRTWSNVAVMRAILDTNTGFTGNEVARAAGMHPNSALKALTLLEGLGIVKRQIGGRDHIFTLNRKHYLVKEVILKVFEIENKFPKEITSTLESILKKRVYSAVIFGSSAKKKETVLSDLDICIIVNTSTDRKQVSYSLNEKAHLLNKKFGIKVAPIFFTKAQFMKKRKSKLIKNIMDDGILITGKHPKSLIHG